MFDSGTTLTILPQKVFSSLRRYFMTYYSHLPSLSSQTNVLDRSVVLTSPPSSDWPTIEYYFGRLLRVRSAVRVLPGGEVQGQELLDVRHRVDGHLGGRVDG